MSALSIPVSILEAARTFLENREQLDIGASQVFLMKNTLRNLDGVIARQAITPVPPPGWASASSTTSPWRPGTPSGHAA